MTYTGPERRATKRDWSQRLGFWMLTHAGVLAIVVILHFLLLGFIAIGVTAVAQSSSDSVDRLKEQVELGNRTSADAAQVADFLRECLLKPTAERDPNKCGADNSSQVIQGLLTYMDCAFLAVPRATQAQLDDCKRIAFGR